jgi:prepilin-type N-terminal cleavage/methylation domain-containing protein
MRKRKKAMMTRTRFFSDEAGFTMIEALIALAIFSIGILALGALQANSLKSTGDVARKAQAWTAVEDEAARLQQMPFYDPTKAPATFSFVASLTATAPGAWNSASINGYDVFWTVVDNTPIVAQTNPPFEGVQSGTYTVSKQITVVATLPGGNPATDALAQVEFIKTWAETGCNYD